ncbi:MAG: hypothetical protein ACYDEN_13735 [Acidimicrobiales bacterium]
MAPLCSPDGTQVAFVGCDDARWDSDLRLWGAPRDGSAEPELVAPDTDRGIGIAFPGLSTPSK